MRKVTSAMSELARILSVVLAENLGCPRHQFGENCIEITCSYASTDVPMPFFVKHNGLGAPHGQRFLVDSPPKSRQVDSN
ncbi:hypothetical protein KSP39_PZI003685 [Platanthera zijinensis]|uniref:Uncharacterized protein n=1 Tax=Platanthera zijinensis TaxID=2320716 RepID=A0AAP0BV63_9ASPA